MPFKNPHPLYSVWQSMRARCRNPNANAWPDYGGRGIKVCERWSSFAAFVGDMGPRPPGYSLDRINNNFDYTPENCRWTNRKTQQRNQRRAVYVTIEGRVHRAIELAEISGLKVDTIVKRAADGLPYAAVMSPGRRVFTAGLALGGRASGRKQQSRTHCSRGHEFTPKNTRITPEGWRNCRQCHNEKMRRRNAAKRAEQLPG